MPSLVDLRRAYSPRFGPDKTPDLAAREAAVGPGADFEHNPECASLEVYETYAGYDTRRVLTQRTIQEAAVAVYGSPVARHAAPDETVTEYDLSGDWPADM